MWVPVLSVELWKCTKQRTKMQEKQWPERLESKRPGLNRFQGTDNRTDLHRLDDFECFRSTVYRNELNNMREQKLVDNFYVIPCAPNGRHSNT